MARPRKNPEDRLEPSPAAQLAPLQSGPIPVQVMNPPAANPFEGKYPKEDEPIEKRRYLFTYNQNPGTPMEFTKGRSVLKKNGMPGLVFEKFCLEDGQEYELPVDVVKDINKLMYHEEGMQRPRCSCVEV